ncbi:MAG: hypothetical protein Q7W02_02330 [Candidatus Rokubacteria bacterium]|nr:hypothetical protein [Candidatus Rokubacteria bacterium]
MATRHPVHRTCPAPKPFGSPCNHRLEGAEIRCHAHQDADPTRQCAAVLGRNGTSRRCAAWPMPGLPFCAAHDPVTIALRREEAQSARARIAAVRQAVAAAPVLIQGKMLDLLVVERQVDVGAVEAVARRYQVLG